MICVHSLYATSGLGGDKIEKLIVNASVESIPEGAFSGFTGVKEVVLGEGI